MQQNAHDGTKAIQYISSIVILRRLNWRQFERLACFEDIKPVVGILSEMETIE